MSINDYDKYLTSPKNNKKEIGYSWYTAIGLQEVDGLKTSKYLEELAVKNIEEDISIDEASELIQNYYHKKEEISNDRTIEADLVSVRIAKILQEKSFVFSPVTYINIHKQLFTGIYDHAGKVRDYNITKKEWVLNGDTVTYGNAFDLKETLEYDLNCEKNFKYNGLSKKQIVSHLARFVANLWQIHIFGEGNTRTTSVFFILYLRKLGYNVTNDVFAKNAWYFRNSLVRANYTNVNKNIFETTKYLEDFIENLLFNEKHDLKNRYLSIDYIVNQDIKDKSQDIEDKNRDIEDKSQDIEKLLEQFKLNVLTKNNIINIYNIFKDSIFFGRNDICKKINLAPSNISELIKKMLEMGLIEPVRGVGKGKYKFVK